MDMMLPYEIVSIIINYLDDISILNLREVNKYYRDTIDTIIKDRYGGDFRYLNKKLLRYLKSKRIPLKSYFKLQTEIYHDNAYLNRNYIVKIRQPHTYYFIKDIFGKYYFSLTNEVVIDTIINQNTIPMQEHNMQIKEFTYYPHDKPFVYKIYVSPGPIIYQDDEDTIHFQDKLVLDSELIYQCDKNQGRLSMSMSMLFEKFHITYNIEPYIQPIYYVINDDEIYFSKKREIRYIKTIADVIRNTQICPIFAKVLDIQKTYVQKTRTNDSMFSIIEFVYEIDDISNAIKCTKWSRELCDSDNDYKHKNPSHNKKWIYCSTSINEFCVCYDREMYINTRHIIRNAFVYGNLNYPIIVSNIIDHFAPNIQKIKEYCEGFKISTDTLKSKYFKTIKNIYELNKFPFDACKFFEEYEKC